MVEDRAGGSREGFTCDLSLGQTSQGRFHTVTLRSFERSGKLLLPCVDVSVSAFYCCPFVRTADPCQTTIITMVVLILNQRSVSG